MPPAWIREIHCHGAEELAAITIATNSAPPPGPRISLVVKVPVFSLSAQWQLVMLIHGQLGPVPAAPQGNPGSTPVCRGILVGEL